MIEMENLENPPGLLITWRGFHYRRPILDCLKALELEYTEHRGFLRGEIVVTLPQGKDTGRIREYLAERGKC
jgi:hypothetical protein